MNYTHKVYLRTNQVITIVTDAPVPVKVNEPFLYIGQNLFNLSDVIWAETNKPEKA